MIRKYIVLLLFLALCISISALDLGLELGFSTFRYAEIGENSKEDLYTFDSVILGVYVAKPINNFSLKASVSAELPYEFTFSDALGSDEKDYLDDFFYYGLNTRLSLEYMALKRDVYSLYLGVLLNYDYFYFEDMVITIGNKFIYSILGAGPGVRFNLHLSELASFQVNGSYIFNFFPLYDRGNDFLWSDNILISFGINISLG